MSFTVRSSITLNHCSALLFLIIVFPTLLQLGYRMGILQKVQVTAAVHTKLLRLNLASITAISAGQVVNLVSNDARRFDDYAQHLPWLVLAPLELGMVGLEFRAHHGSELELGMVAGPSWY
jgi:ABC-type multidrug transport system fused ATPase/permease subunit